MTNDLEIPDGWQLTPIMPNTDMITAAAEVNKFSNATYAEIYNAMCRTSPLLPQQGEQTDTNDEFDKWYAARHATDAARKLEERCGYPRDLMNIAWNAACAAVLPQVGEAVAYRYRVLVDKHLTGPALEGEFEFKGVKGKSSGWMLSAEFPDDDFLLEVIPLAPAILGEAKAVAQEGWKLVPVESTDDMHKAYTREKYSGNDPVLIPNLWKALLDAAPVADAPPVAAETNPMQRTVAVKVELLERAAFEIQHSLRAGDIDLKIIGELRAAMQGEKA